MQIARIEGLVAAVLNERELILNVGLQHGVKRDMKFKVLESPMPVTDPITNKKIGDVQREKIRVAVHTVHDQMSIAQTYEVKEVVTGSMPNVDSLRVRFQPQQIVRKVRTLRRDPSSEFHPLDEESSLVKRGDPVHEILDSEQISGPK